MNVSANTIDDLMRKLIYKIRRHGIRIVPGKGPCKEIVGVRAALRNPLARISLTQTRDVLFSSLGEFLWYMSGSDRLDFIQYYISSYSDYSDDKTTLNGAYGPRLMSQLDEVIERLRKGPSRNAVITILSVDDLRKKTKDVPCTSTLQFLLREAKLSMVTTMRSNDIYIGFPHDVFAFTMLQEIVARELDAALDTYTHFAGSLHLYEKNYNGARRYLAEGVQRGTIEMPPMPTGPQRSNVTWLLDAEKKLRLDPWCNLEDAKIERYWSDLAEILRAKAHVKAGKDISLDEIEKRVNACFGPFLRIKEHKENEKSSTRAAKTGKTDETTY